MRAIVLSGGGSKGSYQIGVWKALRKLNIKYDIVTGTSVGALNGALMTQNSYFKAKRLWNNLTMKKIFKDIDETDSLKVYKTYSKNFLINKGTDVKGLEEIIDDLFNPNRFYNSKINFGLITFNSTTKKPTIIEKKDIPKNKLLDYLIASSACYPVISKKEIDGNKYIDGGYYDNLPINFASKLGADEIIAVDLHAPGIKRITKKNVKVIKISPNNKLSNFMIFDKYESRRNMKYGYNDTMKVFNKYEGHKYTFKLNTIKKITNKYEDTLIYTFKQIFSSKASQNTFKKLMNIDNKFNSVITNTIIIKTIEQTAYTLGIDDTKIYNEKTLNKLIKKELKRQINSHRKELEIYKYIKRNNYSAAKKVGLTHPKEFLCALYLYTIDED